MTPAWILPWRRVCCSIHRDRKLAYHPAELRALARQECTHVLGLARLHALRAQRCAHLRVGERKRGLALQELDDIRRHALGTKQHRPAVEIEVADARLLEGRHIRQRARAHIADEPDRLYETGIDRAL